jgi:hypothetical protein
MTEQLKWITQAIAQPYEIQKRLFPDFVCVADELALEWESALDSLHSSFDNNTLTCDQKAAIENLDNYIVSISGFEQHWCDEALCHGLEWRKIRDMAYHILVKMGWEREAPPNIANRIYIGS